MSAANLLNITAFAIELQEVRKENKEKNTETSGNGGSSDPNKNDDDDDDLGGDKKKNTFVYEGTKNPKQRAQQHNDRFDQLDLVTEQPVTRRQSRAIEQVIKERNLQYSNKINSISSKRNWYKKAIRWGKKWLENNK